MATDRLLAIPSQRCRHGLLLVVPAATLRRGYARALATAGYVVRVASTVTAAHELIAASTPDVAVVEVGPGVADTALVASLGVRRVPVLAVAGADAVECAARQAGAAAFLARPFGPHVLLPAVRVLLSGACRPVPPVPHECGGAVDAFPGAAMRMWP